MSRGQLARTPEHFPNMKYRAWKRHCVRWISTVLAVRVMQTLCIELPAALATFAARVRVALARSATRTAIPRRPWYLALEDAQARGARGRTNPYYQPALPAAERVHDDA
ncbi:hypothetical protein [Nocardia salmonicida]|uniref:hypothetical protein n=1 Tax=Nocardia salmonicida TaxID=53431 RepID=UPI002E2887DA|nr:hypothetical protein [Nocardia salmonicida]